MGDPLMEPRDSMGGRGAGGEGGTRGPGRRRERPRIVFHHSAGAVIVDGGRCLVLRRADRDEWVFPKGHLEVGEDPPAAARREVAEETGLEVALLAPLGSTRYRFGPEGRQRKQVDWFLARPVGGRLSPEAIFAEAAFLSWDEADARLRHDDDRKVLADARRMASALDGPRGGAGDPADAGG